MNDGALFLDEAYLAAMHETGCASARTGWQRLDFSGAAPLYRKAHSWGEFVFDFEFARAYAQAGLEYYPKLVCAVPYTPVTGPRLRGQASGEALQQRCEEQAASSAHILFLPQAEARLIEGEGWLRRDDVRFVWTNRGYAHFDAFLAALASKKRKNIRAERRKLAALELDIRWQTAAEFSRAEWDQLFALYASTYALRGQAPYLNQDCLMQWARTLPEAYVFCVARQHSRLVAMAYFFRDQSALYGRHWGSSIVADSLHFELCYYRGIEYCIAHGLERFDAGVQGEHRLLRGFEPVRTQSMHWFSDRRFQAAIGHYLLREREMMRRQFEHLRQKTAFAERGL